MPAPKCPICKQYAESLIHVFLSEAEQKVVARVRERHPSWSVYQGMCERCLYMHEFERVEDRFLPDPELQGGDEGTALRSTLYRARVGNEFALLPLPLRLNADPRFRGRGVTIAVIDSGFYPHPDLVKPRNRIKAIVDVTDERRPQHYFKKPQDESWHGTMTAVTAAGSGTLSDGTYRAVASEAEVVLIKVFNVHTKRISRADILRALKWTADHAEEYNIGVVSMSVYDDEPVGLGENPVDRAVDEVVEQGIVVVAAVGNNPESAILPPASSAAAITVGGVDDRNEVWKEYRRMFHSTHGTTREGHVKPELIAPAIWIAGPMLPETVQFREAALLFRLLKATPRRAELLLERYRADVGSTPRNLARRDYKAWARARIAERKYVAPGYKHVDGTSFSAPIVSSVVAQMLEVDPTLSPSEIKTILMETAEPLRNVPAEHQGKGVLNPRAAVLRTLARRHEGLSPGVHTRDGQLLFIYHNRVPRTVALAGTFNNWDAHSLRLYESRDGWWSVRLPKPAPGVYQYKFVIDDAVWLEDPANTDRVPDGFGGWNSKLVVQ